MKPEYYIKKESGLLDMLTKRNNFNEVSHISNEPGLIDISAYLLPRAAAGAILKNPVSKPFVGKYIPDPKWWQKTRDAKNGLYNSIIGAGATASVVDEIIKK